MYVHSVQYVVYQTNPTLPVVYVHVQDVVYSIQYIVYPHHQAREDQ